MTQWIRVTIAAPEDKLSDANELACVIGFSEHDRLTFGDPVYQDSEGNRYAVASTLAKASFTEDAMSELQEPEWGADMVAATRAQAIVTVQEPATPDTIAAYIGDDAMVALAELGISVIAE